MAWRQCTSDDHLLGDEVSKFIVGSERDVIGLGDSQPDGSVEVDDMVV